MKANELSDQDCPRRPRILLSKEVAELEVRAEEERDSRYKETTGGITGICGKAFGEVQRLSG